jgi:hypothetical protein
MPPSSQCNSHDVRRYGRWPSYHVDIWCDGNQSGTRQWNLALRQSERLVRSHASHNIGFPEFYPCWFTKYAHYGAWN